MRTLRLLIAVSAALTAPARAVPEAPPAGTPTAETPAYYKAGEVGAFAVTISLPARLNLSRTAFVLDSPDHKTYLLHASSPAEALYRRRVQRYRGTLALTPTQAKRVAQIEAEDEALTKRIDSRRAGALESRRNTLEQLRDAEKAKPQPDKAFLARTERDLADLKKQFQAVEKLNDQDRARLRALRREAEYIREREHGVDLPAADRARIDRLRAEHGRIGQAVDKRNTWEISRQVEWLKAAMKTSRDAAALDREYRQKLKEEIARLEAKLTSYESSNHDDRARMAAIDKEIDLTIDAARSVSVGEDAPVLRVVGRFQGAGPAAVVVRTLDTAAPRAKPRDLVRITLDLPAKDGGSDKVLKDWARMRVRYLGWLCATSPFHSFQQYCAIQTARKYGLDKEDYPPFARDPDASPLDLVVRGRDSVDLYSITTGALAIQESLQLDAMTAAGRTPEPATVALKDLAGPTIQSHPFAKMLRGREPKIFPAARLVPHDAYYGHFSSISKLIAASDMLRDWGASLLRTATVTSREAHLPRKYQQQLCIGVSRLTRLFGDLIIGEVALTGSDPFLFEGTDLAVIIHVRRRGAFDKQMNGYLQEAMARHRDAVRATRTFQGTTVLSVTTPDRSVCSYSAYVGPYKVYANSPALLERIIRTAGGRYPSLADSKDFQYMRTIFPGSADAEDGFLYFSDAFIRKLVGPRWKISEQRRLVCQTHLRMLANAATMRRRERRAPAADLATLRRENYLPAAPLTCPDGGTYELAKDGTVRCSVHHALGLCTPVDQIPLAKVTKQEAKDYRRFVEEYNDYWRQYFDPIGIRLHVGDRVEAETCILPLIENSIYNQVRDLVGGRPVPLRARVLTDETILAVSAKLDLTQPGLRRMLDETQQQLLPGSPPITRAVGQSVSLGVCDGDVLFTVDESSLGRMGFMDFGEQLLVATVLSAVNLPLYAVVDLRSAEDTRAILDQLTASWSQSRGPFEDRWFSVERYETSSHGPYKIRTLGLRLAVVRFRLHWTIAKGRLIVATKRRVLDAVLDALAGADRSPPVVANVHVDIRPEAYKKLLPAARAGWQERLRRACLRNLLPVKELVECHHADPADPAGLAAAALRHHGEVPYCPSGGTYVYNPALRVVRCSVHGDLWRPRQPAQPIGRERILALLQRLRAATVTLQFTPEGVRTKVRLDLTGGGAREKAKPPPPRPPAASRS